MNLVAKEFVAARDDERGVLILSQFTGAARELSEALIVNPYDTEQCAAALRVALTMPPDEQRHRMRSMRGLIQEFNVYRWAGRMLLDAARMRNRRRVGRSARTATDHRSAAGMTMRRMPPFAPDWAFFLDIDGTLVEFAAHPRKSASGRTAGVARTAARRTGGAVALVSGRSVEDIDNLFAPLSSRSPASTGRSAARRRNDTPTCAAAREPRPRRRRLVRLTAAHAGLVFENKGMTLALHYRLAPALRTLAEQEMRALAAALGDAFELQTGKFVVEIKPSGKDKGSAIAEFIAEAPFAGRRPVFIGDDLTDEPGFEVVNRVGRPLREGRPRHHAGALAPVRCRRRPSLARIVRGGESPRMRQNRAHEQPRPRDRRQFERQRAGHRHRRDLLDLPAARGRRCGLLLAAARASRRGAISAFSPWTSMAWRARNRNTCPTRRSS